MAAFFLDGRIAVLVLAVLALEVLVLCCGQSTRTRLPALLPNLLSGAALVGALGLALHGADWRLLALALAVAGLSHAADLRVRLRVSGA